MIEEKNTAIITYMDKNFEENLKYDFLETLCNVFHYQGTICVLDYGMEQEYVKDIQEKFKVKVYQVEKRMPVFSNRYRDIPKVIDSLDDRITHIMTCDGGDVWFQKPVIEVFNQAGNRIGCVEEERIIGHDNFTDFCIEKIKEPYKRKLLALLEGKAVKNSGVICGPRIQMRNLIEKVFQDMVDCKTEFFGIDQLYFNVEWYKLMESERTTMDETYNYIVITNKNKYITVEDKLYTKEGKLITVVHNAGANWRVLKRSYNNKNSDQEQYYPENIREI